MNFSILTFFPPIFPEVNEIRGARRRMSTLDDKAGRDDLSGIGELSLRDSKEESDKVRGVKFLIMTNLSYVVIDTYIWLIILCVTS